MEITGWRAWLIAIRPQTLPAGAAPVIVGMAVASYEGLFSAGPAFAALIGALLIQIGTNLANDYYDAQRGVDSADREGFTRVTHEGIIAAEQIRLAMVVSFSSAIAVGTYLVYIGGVPIVIIGLVSVACGIAYAGGPFPFGSYGLGDLFVFVFFGIIAVTGTVYVQAANALADPFPLTVPAGTITASAIIASIAMGALATAILVVNNLRDIETDAAAGKYTLAVIIGPVLTRVEYAILLFAAYLVPLAFWALFGTQSLLLPLLSLPLAAILVYQVIGGRSGAKLNETLERTGQLQAAFALLFAVGVIIS